MDVRLEESPHWALLWPHRDRLLRIARRRTECEQDAEDCVHEALLRCAAVEDVDPERVGGLLTTVTIRLCIDLARARRRARLASGRLHADDRLVPGPDEIVCDRAEAVWLETKVAHLAARERAVLRARADGFSVGEAATALGITYKAAEGAFTRARVKLHRAIGAAVALVVAVRGRARLAAGSVPALALAGFVVLGGLGGSGADEPPEVSLPAVIQAPRDLVESAQQPPGAGVLPDPGPVHVPPPPVSPPGGGTPGGEAVLPPFDVEIEVPSRCYAGNVVCDDGALVDLDREGVERTVTRCTTHGVYIEGTVVTCTPKDAP